MCTVMFGTRLLMGCAKCTQGVYWIETAPIGRYSAPSKVNSWSRDGEPHRKSGSYPSLNFGSGAGSHQRVLDDSSLCAHC